MSGLSGIDPRVEEILRELARDPRSSLLRVERPRVARELFEKSPRVNLGATGLSAAERELLRAHRAEAAWLLKEICKERLANEERSRLFLSRYIDAEREVEILEPAEQRRHAEELRALDLPLVQDPLAELDVFGLLERATAGPAETRPSIAQLALASLRLEPEDSTRICLALDLIASDTPRFALALLHRILAQATAPDRRFESLTNLSLAAGRIRAWDLACDAARRAVTLAPDRIQGKFNWAVYSLQKGDLPQLRRASASLSTEEEGMRAALGVLAGALRMQVRGGRVSLTAEARMLWRKVQDPNEGLARVICHAMFE